MLGAWGTGCASVTVTVAIGHRPTPCPLRLDTIVYQHHCRTVTAPLRKRMRCFVRHLSSRHNLASTAPTYLEKIATYRAAHGGSNIQDRRLVPNPTLRAPAFPFNSLTAHNGIHCRGPQPAKIMERWVSSQAPGCRYLVAVDSRLRAT